MTLSIGKESLATRRQLKVGSEIYGYHSIAAAERLGLGDFSCLPASLAIVLENLLRFKDGSSVRDHDISALSDWCNLGGRCTAEISFRPARVLMQDFTGVPAVVDLAAMRDGIKALGGDPTKINPQIPVDLVIDHSVSIDEYGNPRAFRSNVELEYERNMERYKFLKWGQSAFDNFRVVPPGTGICHQVNLEYLSRTVWSGRDESGATIAFPDTVVGTDSHTTMVNGLAVLGWGVGGIEAEASMLGQPFSMLVPEVVGFEMTGALPEGTTATDLVLTVVKMLREKGVVGKFVEFFGSGLDRLPIADRATIANMAPEYGATCGFFPVDEETLRYLRQSNRDEALVNLVEAYAKENGIWRRTGGETVYSDRLHLELENVVPAISGPRRPQEHTPLDISAKAFREVAVEHRNRSGTALAELPVEGQEYALRDGSVVIASITSCTNTSNPYVMIGAGLLARKARALGLNSKPWVKTSLAPGSKVVTEYLEASGLQEDLDAIGFNLVGYGCTTCIGNSGPLRPEISEAIDRGDLVAVSVLSGNRNFEGRINPDVRANYLASPPLVIAYALAGDMNVDLTREPVGTDKNGNSVWLKDIWPTSEEIAELVERTVTREAFSSKYAEVFLGDERWQAVPVPASQTYDWPVTSTYVKNPPYFDGISAEPPGITDIRDARILAVLGDMVTTDHISPAGSFAAESPAGEYLVERQVQRRLFNSYGARRGNHEIMMRGTFANIRLRNQMLEGVEGGFTIGPDGAQTTIYEAAMEFQKENTPLVVFAGRQYGAGSSRDWAAKGTRLLGVRAVIAVSFERIHRSNLVGMGVVPFEFLNEEDHEGLMLNGDETITINGLEEGITPRMTTSCQINFSDGAVKELQLRCRVDTEVEVDYLFNGGVLQFVLRRLAQAA